MIHLRVICVIALTLLDRSKQTLKWAFPCFTLTGNVPRKGYTSASSSHRTRATFDGMSTATFPASDKDLEFLHEKWWRNGNSWFCLLKSWFKNHRSVLKTLTLGKKTLKFSGVTFQPLHWIKLMANTQCRMKVSYAVRIWKEDAFYSKTGLLCNYQKVPRSWS